VADQSLIEWTDATWTPIQAVRRDNGKRGVACIKVSPACQNCYAERFNMRNLPSHGTGLPFTVQAMEQVDIVLNDEILLQPLSWKKPRRIFVCSQTDLFGEFVTDEMIDRVFAVMALCPQHTFQVLTKRPERMLRWATSIDDNEGGRIAGECYRDSLMEGEAQNIYCKLHPAADPSEWLAVHQPLSNVWLGVTAENQETADKRIPVLLQTPAAKRFVSVEPMLGPVHGKRRGLPLPLSAALENLPDLSGIDWVICGGESGPGAGAGARPMHPDWARSLRDQCQDAGVPFFFKQWGAWQNGSDKDWNGRIVLNDGRSCETPEDLDMDTRNRWPSFRPMKMSRVGKRAAGRLLDGREWSEFPVSESFS